MINDRETSFDFELNIGGEVIDESTRLSVSEIIFEERIEHTARVEFRIEDHDNFSVTYDSIRLEQPVSLRIGWRGLLDEVFQGVISEISPVIEQDRKAYLIVTAFDWTYFMKKYTEMPELYRADNHLQIVQRVLQKYNDKYTLDYVIDGSGSDEIESNPKLTDRQLTDEEAEFRQDGKTDYEFLTGIAEQNDYILLARGSTLYFVNREYFAEKTSSPRYTFYFRPKQGDEDDQTGILLYHFKPRNRTEGQRTHIRVMSWASVDEDGAIKGDDELAELKDKKNYTNLIVESTKVEKLTILGELVSSSAAAHILAQSELQKRARRFVEGQCRCKGWPLIRMGQKHKFKIRALGNIGETFSGEYLITGVEHRWQSDIGFYTSFDVERDNLTETN